MADLAISSDQRLGPLEPRHFVENQGLFSFRPKFILSDPGLLLVSNLNCANDQCFALKKVPGKCKRKSQLLGSELKLRP